nr:integrin beta-PS-like isoform X2 [Nomia melanderi]
MMCFTLLLLFSIQLFPSISTEYKNPESLCSAQQSCRSCLLTPRCVWCAARVSSQSNSSLIRCTTRERYQKEGDHWCPRSDVINDANQVTVITNRRLSSTNGAGVVQVQPQKIQLKLRRGEEQNITLSYSQAANYPVDLYYIMDVSWTMERYRNELSELAGQLAKAMQKLTSNFRLGFGSFIDKVTLPMTNTEPLKLQNPCENCSPPYGFKNHMRLSEDIDLFKTNVRRARTSGNFDGPEGGLDALMQAIVCSKEIGWREHARRLIVFSTDSPSHIAGDGKLAGLIEPNDCLCHMDDEGYYTYSVLQDYPSIGQINKVARKHDVNIIFAVTENAMEWYNLMSKRITGSSTGTLDKGSNNIVNLISGEYEKLVQSVTLIDDAPRTVDVKYFSRCLTNATELQERRECGGLRAGNVVHFDVLLKAVECPANSSEWQQTVQIKPSGINESLTIDLSIICGCPCDQPGHPGYQPGSEDCRGKGTTVCGVCVCDDGFYGKFCECDGHDFGAGSEAAIAECKPDNETAEICSGRGVCKCSVCNCMKRPNPKEIFYGKYCECDNFSCKRSKGLVCNDKGKCECGTCDCIAGWSGEACDCRETNSTCLPPKIGEICSGHGDCVCGSCQCHEKDGVRYSGKYCDHCPTCPAEYCEVLKDCVECKAYNSGPYSQNGKCDLCPHQIDIVDVIEPDSVKDLEMDAKICHMPDDGGCNIIFKYQQNDDASRGDIKIFNILAQKEKMCPEPLNVFGIAIGLVASTVFFGFLVIVIWKVSTMIYDRREFAKFIRAQAVESKGDNPLYKQATSTFQNPTFRGTARD